MQPIRIGYDARFINDRYHGVGRYAYNLVEALIRLAPQYTFVLFRGKDMDSRFGWESLAAHPNVEIRDGPWPLYTPLAQIQWFSILRQSHINLFHSPYYLVPISSSLPTLITVHDLIFDRYPAYIPNAWYRPYYRLLMAWGTSRACKIISVSRATAVDLRRYYKVPVEKIIVVPEGVDQIFSTPKGSEQLQAIKHRYNLDRPIILTVGVRRPHKNLARLVQAFHRLQAEIPHNLVAVGEPDTRFPDEARHLAAELGLDGRARFLDWVPEVDLTGIYGVADLVVLPSLIEGFGLPALEAMACGVPVIAANNSSFPEVMGEAGVLVDPYDVEGLAAAIGRLIKDNTKRQELVSAGKEHAAGFTWQVAAQSLLSVYEAILR